MAIFICIHINLIFWPKRILSPRKGNGKRKKVYKAFLSQFKLFICYSLDFPSYLFIRLFLSQFMKEDEKIILLQDRFMARLKFFLSYPLRGIQRLWAR